MFEPFSERPIALTRDDGILIGRKDYAEAELLALHRDMLKARIFDERLVTLLRKGKTSFYAQSTGMEATQVGIARAIQPKHDWLYPYYRDQGILLALGVPMHSILSQMLGSIDDESKGRQMPHHFSNHEYHVVSVCSAIASHLAPAAGTAMAQKYLATDEITFCTFGDGATSEGDWHAGINMAAVNDAPCVFVCENNQWAISTGVDRQTKSSNIAIKAKAYGIEGYFVDGQDVLAVQAVSRFVAEKVRSEQKPILLECLTYRIGTHSSADDDSRYRSKEEVGAWRAKDPIRRLEGLLEHRGILPSPEDLADYRIAVIDEFEACVRKADLSGYPQWKSMFEDVYSDIPPHLQEQYALLAEEQ